MAAQEVRVVFVTSNIDKDQRLGASRLVDAELGLLGLVARSESNWFEGWGVGSEWSCLRLRAGYGWVEA